MSIASSWLSVGVALVIIQQAEYDCTIATEKLLRLCNEFSRDYAAFVVVKAQLSFPVAKYPFFTNCHLGELHA